MPGLSDDTVVLVPVPLMLTLSGLRVKVHVPLDGNPFNTTLPVAVSQVGCVIVPINGAAGSGLTVREYVSLASSQGDPRGLSVVTVITTVDPASPAAGV